MKVREILVTSALPYANGYIHLGHLVEYIQTDIWVRAMKAQGHQEANGVTPEEQIASVKASHEADFAKFLINFDNYHSTHSEENREFSELIYRRLNSAGHISTKDVKQLFDPEKNMFLPDRFVKGAVPPMMRPTLSIRIQRYQMRRQYLKLLSIISLTYQSLSSS